MKPFADLFQTADWKNEKHSPAIEVPERVKKGEDFQVKVTVGKEIPHPNTTEHHISWIEVYFLPQGGRFPFQIGRFEFTAHGESTEGPNTSTVYTKPEVVLFFRTEKPGTIYAFSYCNIHGLWANQIELVVE